MLKSTAALASVLMISVSIIGPALADQRGIASWYSLPGNRTACGEKMNPSAMTAAHRTLPCGTRIKVTNKKNGNTVIVRVNDRGPFIKGRIVDVSKAAGKRLGLNGVGAVSVSVIR